MLLRLQGFHFIKKIYEMNWSENLGHLFNVRLVPPSPEMKFSEIILH